MGSRFAIALVATVAALGLAGTAAAATGRISDDPLQSQEWWLHDIGADQATPPGPGVPLAIVDSGLDVTTPEFVGRPDVTLLNDQSTFGPEEWHGTFVASVAAAAANGVDIVGVYPQAALEIWDSSPVDHIVNPIAAVGIETAAQHCPTVISLSFGGRTPDPQVADAIIYAQHRGCLVVASAGNDGEEGSPPSYPASQAHVLTVAATDENDAPADFSTVSPMNDLAAPGKDIVGAVPLSFDPTGVSTQDGTSFSAPMVSAAAAWVWTVRPTLDATQIFQVMRSSARDVGPPGFDPATGFGILDIPAALAAPTPPSDPLEPNDDVNEVKPGALFHDGEPAITTVAKPSTTLAGSLDANKDPRDLYRIWVPAHRTVRVSVVAAGGAAARIWGPQTVSVVGEGLALRRRDLKGTQMSGGNRGSAAYVEVLPTGKTVRPSYVLTVKASRS